MMNTLIGLFDFQGFENNPALRRVIDAVHDRYAVRMLTPDEMERLSAAGVPDRKKEEMTFII